MLTTQATHAPVAPMALASTRLSVAPMMAWTDRHCRYFHRQLSKHALLYTEMVTAPALVRGGAEHLLDHHMAEYPCALQLGGSEPAELARASKIGAEAGFSEINLNCGCPSDRVQSGMFGAVLMRDPSHVRDCVGAMVAAVDLPVTVKCRIGVDDQEPREILPAFLQSMREGGVNRIIIHARKAWLAGLSPKENRTIPPLEYALVHEMKREFPDLHLSINGGIESLDEVSRHLAIMDGVMVGRAAYHKPGEILGTADWRIFGHGAPASSAETRPFDPVAVVHKMEPYIADHLAQGGTLYQVTRHMLGLFAGRPGARAWRQVLSTRGTTPGAGLEVLKDALGPLREGVPEPI